MAQDQKIVTNVTRLLQKAGIPFSTGSYEVDESDLSAVHAAKELGTDAENVYKTLVCTADKTHAVFVIPAAAELDLKKCAVAAGVKRCEMLPLKDLTPLTGYVRGGCSPVGMKKRFPTYLDESALPREKIYVSAGKRGCQIVIAPRDLMRACDAKAAPLIREEEKN